MFADVVDTKKFTNLLNWSLDNLWVSKEDSNYKTNALFFYKEKTIQRVNKFLEKYNLVDKEDYINGLEVPSMEYLINSVNFDSIIGADSTGFHGDFILDNILINDNTFTLIDWRQDFNGSIESGDMNYDLAKLNHNLILNHEILANNHYTINLSEGILCDVHVKKSFLDCKKILEDFCKKNFIDYKSIEILSSIIWINMSPLHEHPLDIFLYYFGKYNLFLNLL